MQSALNSPIVSNPKDHLVVTFHNSTDFGFTPEMGCMYDGRAINGSSGNPGIEAGESKLLPYHIGHQLATNLAKRVFNTSPAASVDPAGIPTGVPVWNPTKLQELANTFIKEEYSDEKPVAMSETDKLMLKVAELEKFMKEKLADTSIPQPVVAESAPTVTVVESDMQTATATKFVEPPKVYQDKKQVIEELTKRGIKFTARSTKAELEKLLA